MLWKYKSVANLDFVEELVLGDRVYFAAPPELNDPSETRFDIQPEFSFDLSAYLHDLSQRATQAEVEDVIRRTLEVGAFEAIFGESLRNLFKGMLLERCRLLCLTKTPTNPLMWAHYAGNHAGVCVGIDLDRLLSQIRVAVHAEVRYHGRPFQLPFRGPKDLDDDLDTFMRKLAQALFIKDQRWSYEQELRLVTVSGPAVQHAPSAVRSIAIGLRASNETRKLVTRWKEQRPHLEIFQVTQGVGFEFDLSTQT